MRAGTTDPVTVSLEWDRKVFGKIEGKAGVNWEPDDGQKTEDE